MVPEYVLMGVTVRRAAVDDWPEVRDLRLAALQDTPDAFGATFEEEAAFAPEDWQGRLSRPDAATYLAGLADEDQPDAGPTPAGLMTLLSASALPGLDEPPGTGIIVAVWVAPRARGRGVADRLLEAVLAGAPAAGYTRLVLDVADGNPHAQALYARHGFVRTGRTGTLPPPRTHVTEHQLAREVP